MSKAKKFKDLVKKKEQPDTVISFQSSVSFVIARAISRFKPKLIVRESNTASFATAANDIGCFLKASHTV